MTHNGRQPPVVIYHRPVWEYVSFVGRHNL